MAELKVPAALNGSTGVAEEKIPAEADAGGTENELVRSLFGHAGLNLSQSQGSVQCVNRSRCTLKKHNHALDD